MRRPYLAPKDGGGPDQGVDPQKRRPRRSYSTAPWERAPSRRSPSRPVQSSPPAPGRRPTHTRAVPRQAPPPAHQAPPTHDASSSSLALMPDASAASFSREEAESFWSLPSFPAVEPLGSLPHSDSESLSGSAEHFDDSTGWVFPAADLPEDLEPRYEIANEQRNAPFLPSAEELFSGAMPASVSRTQGVPVGLHIPDTPPAPRSLPPPPPPPGTKRRD